MLCEYSKDALIDAAASGTAPSGELRVHLAACALCRGAFARELSLLDAIDCGVHAAVNIEIPPSLVPRVCASIDEVRAPGSRSSRPLVFASASVVLVLLVFLMSRAHHGTAENVGKQGPSVSSPMTSLPKLDSEEISPADTQFAGIRVGHSHARLNSTNRHSAASSNPEVLVPADEREGLARLVAELNQRSDVAAALVAKAPERKEAAVGLDRLQIEEIEIKPLEGREAETSDGVGKTP